MLVDLIVENACVRTLDPIGATVNRMAIHGERVIALGDEVSGLRAQRVLDMAGATVLPGFNDAHCHPVMFGTSLDELDLSDRKCSTRDDLYRLIIERVRSTPEGSWIVGARYDDNKLGGHPDRRVLDEIAPDHFVWLKHASAHMCTVNGRVLDAVGLLNGSAVVPPGGKVRLEAGLLEEQAQRLVRGLVTPLSEDQIARALGRACEVALGQGVTSWTDAGVGGGWIGHAAREVGGYLLARQTGRLPIRSNLMIASDCLHEVDRNELDRGDHGLDLGIRSGLGDDRLRIGPVKVFADGSLLGRTAAMCRDYCGEPGNKGYLQDDPERLREVIVQAHLAGWQVAVHAIGDHAVDVVLDSFQEAHKQLPRPDVRHRIEHAGIVSEAQLHRLVSLNVVPVPQGEFVSAMGDAMLSAVGPGRGANLYRQKSYLRAGLIVPGSSDRPVVPGAPLTGIRDLVLRETSAGVIIGESERLTVAEALYAWTVGSAYAEGASERKGTLVPGMLADFVVLDSDPLLLHPHALSGANVVATFVGGACVFGDFRDA